MRWNYEQDRPRRRIGARQYFILAIQLLLTAGFLYLSFHGTDFRAALRRVSAIPPTAAALCFLLLALQTLVLAWRWHALLKFFRCKASLSALIRGVLAERLVNQLVPSTVGGDSARVVTLVADGVPRGPAFLSVVFDRVSGLLGIIIFGGVMSPLALIYGVDPRVALTPAAVAAAALLGCLVLAVMPTSLLRRLTEPLRSGRLTWIAETSHGLLRSSRFLFATGVISILVHVLSCAVFAVIAESMLGPASAIAILVCVPIILVATAAPITVAGWGLRESVSVALFQMFGITAENALSISLLFGLIQLLMALLSGPLLLGLQIGHSVHKLQPERPGSRNPQTERSGL